MAKRIEKFPEVVYRKHPKTLSPHPSPWVRKPGRHLPLFLTLVFLSFVAMAVDVQFGFSWLSDLGGRTAAPFVYAVDKILSPLARSVAFVDETWNARKASVELQARLAKVEKDLHYYQTEFNKNLRYRHLLDLKAQIAPEALAAQVLRYQDSAMQRLIRLRGGTQEGLRVNQAVLTEGGQLLGRIEETNGLTSSVRLITDPSCRIGVAIETTQAQGWLYNRNGTLFVSVDRTEEVLEGDRVLTSHLSGRFQEGLLVGRITSPAGDGESDPLVAVSLGLKKSFRVEAVYPIKKWGNIREVLCLPTYENDESNPPSTTR